MKILDEAGYDITDLILWVDARANPFGWSQATFSYKGEIIGGHYCGDVKVKAPYKVVD